jgi:hypothetical protein
MKIVKMGNKSVCIYEPGEAEDARKLQAAKDCDYVMITPADNDGCWYMSKVGDPADWECEELKDG